MKMKNLLAVTAVYATFFAPMIAHADDNVLGGDVRLACEAILCLSSGNRPSECRPSIERYFSISHKKIKDMINARRNFLNICPSSSENAMPRLIEVLVHGAGRCDARELNRVMETSYQEYICSERPSFSRESDPVCKWVTKSYVRNAKPAYCSAYFSHEWTTTGDKIRFVGKEKQGGRWVDVK